MDGIDLVEEREANLRVEQAEHRREPLEAARNVVELLGGELGTECRKGVERSHVVFS